MSSEVGAGIRISTLDVLHYNLINNFSIIAGGARRARSCATAYLLTGAQHNLRAGIVCDDRELFHQIIVHLHRHGCKDIIS